MKVKKSVVFAAALACGILLAVPLGAAAASSYRMAENGPATREESARLNRTFLYLNIEYNDRAPHEQLSLDTAGDSVVSWRSADPSIVTVSPDGVVTACAEGITNVYADTASGTTLSCAVTVTNNIGRVSLSESRLYLEDMGSKAALTASVAVENPAAVPITWRSSNPAVASVSTNGTVKAQGSGKAVISALTTAGQVLRCTVTVTSEIGRVQMSKNAMLLQAVGASQKLTAQAAGAKNGTMTWISSNPGVATVSADGMVTAVGDGETMILAVTPEGRADACYVAVGAAAWRFRSEDELAETLTLTGQLPYSDGK